ncbi:hypothetical protein L9F63_022411, partial [Diploptera punctata]
MNVLKEESDSDSYYVLMGTCPDVGCSALVAWKSTDIDVLCIRCGQLHDRERILFATNLDITAIGAGSVISSLQLTENEDLWKRQNLIKVNGLSNFHSKMISHLLTFYGMDTPEVKPLSEITEGSAFDCSTLAEKCFTIRREQLQISGYGWDELGSKSYLHDTLFKIGLANGNRDALVPLHADGDGHCLVHSVSRAITGRNLFWHPLRAQLKQHFIEKLEEYKRLIGQFVDSNEWDNIILECDPEYRPNIDDDEIHGLRQIHIFGLANVLKRPIFLFDSIEGMNSVGEYS